ncbi:MAG: aminopeptidase [Desulfobacteraceae bacterium]
MLGKQTMEKYAQVLLWGMQTARKEPFSRGDVVIVRFDRAAVPLAEIVHSRLMDFGYHPVMRMGLTHLMEKNFFQKADNDQLVFIPPGTSELYEGLNGSIYLHAPESLTHLRRIDPKRIGRAAVAVKPLRDILNRREDRGSFGWTLCMVPTEELAKRAGLTPRQYAHQIIKACYLNTDDPVAQWENIYREAATIKEWLNALRIKELHLESERVDLRVRQGEQRKWVGISGHNIPSFEIFMSPDWRGTEGVYYADQPSFRSGNYVQGVRLEFRKGRAVKVGAKTGAEFVRKQAAMDEGACRIGEFSLTDRRFSRIDRFMANTLFDENFGGRYGNCHIALGSSYSDTFDGDPASLTKERKEDLGFNDSALHWDLVNTEPKRVTALLESGDELLLYENGLFCGP